MRVCAVAKICNRYTQHTYSHCLAWLFQSVFQSTHCLPQHGYRWTECKQTKLNFKLKKKKILRYKLGWCKNTFWYIMSKTDIVAGLQIMLSSDWYLTYIYNTIFFLNNQKKNQKNTKNTKTKTPTEFFWLTTYVYTEHYQK